MKGMSIYLRGVVSRGRGPAALRSQHVAPSAFRTMRALDKSAAEVRQSGDGFRQPGWPRRHRRWSRRARARRSSLAGRL